MHSEASKIVLLSPDQAIRDSLRAAMRSIERLEILTLNAEVASLQEYSAFEQSALVILDIDGGSREDLIALQKVMIALRGQKKVIVLTDAFDEAVGRWFLQIKVTDFLRKPIRPEELRTACLKALRGASSKERDGEIITFVPAAGGVGNTTIAIEAAIQAVASPAAGLSTCLVDLDFSTDCCAEYLDLEPRLDLAEIGACGERLDIQMLEVMSSRHGSGLSLIASPARPCEPGIENPDLIARLLDTISGCFGNVIIDLPRYWTPWFDVVLRGSDRIFVVTDMTVPGLRAARRVAQRISSSIEGADPRIIVNRATRNFFFGGGLRKADVERALPNMLAGSVSNDYGLVREAIDRGVPLRVVKEKNQISSDLQRIVFAPAAKGHSLHAR